MTTPRSNTLDTSLSVNDILRHYPHAVTLLSSYRIDSCCRGHESLATAAAALGLDPEQVAEQIVSEARPAAEQPSRCSCGCSHSR